jgi:hypothetical protein
LEFSTGEEANMKTREEERLLALAWEEAAGDLLISVVTPYTLLWEGRSYVYPVLIRNFGKEKGSLLVLYSDKREKKLIEVGNKAGFFVRTVFDAYFTYDRSHFIDTLNDLGWFGPKENIPGWYTGAPWS